MVLSQLKRCWLSWSLARWMSEILELKSQWSNCITRFGLNSLSTLNALCRQMHIFFFFLTPLHIFSIYCQKGSVQIFTSASAYVYASIILEENVNLIKMIWKCIGCFAYSFLSAAAAGLHNHRWDTHRADEEQADDQGQELFLLLLLHPLIPAAPSPPTHPQAKAGSAARGFRKRSACIQSNTNGKQSTDNVLSII